MPQLRVEALDNHGRSHAAGGAHGDKAVALALAFQLINHGAHEDRAGGADRVAQRHRAAIDVDLLAVKVEVADELFSHHREGFVDLEEVDVFLLETGLFQHLLGSRHRCVEHQRRAVTHIRHCHHAGTRLQAVLLGVFRGGQQHGSGTIHDARRIAGMVDVVDLEIRIDLVDQLAEGRALLVQLEVSDLGERRLQFGKPFTGRVRAWELFVVQQQLAVMVIDRHQRLVEMTVLDRVVGALLAHKGQVVHRLAVDAFEGRNRIGAHALVWLRVHVAQVLVAAVEERGHGLMARLAVERHHFRAAGDHEVFHAGHDVGRGDVHRGDARAAEAVQRHTGGAHVVARIKRSHAAEVTGLLAALGRGAPNDVVHVFGLQIVALGKRLENGGTEMLRMALPQSTLPGLTDGPRGAARIDDPCFRHFLILAGSCC